ncbi:hypothetical protein JNB88_27430 [Rhizobium cauense]|uniref:hypothetical protein n=1 Tax=Rhizobium cauense TaxID=1166683 RepID=UPI001C6E388A|nr:hypothetical protein [Rhizobium cauense]MBW9117356.1 hypothetical protein [Rhizobium cauense]
MTVTEYKRFYEGLPEKGDLIIKFYRSGGKIRGFVRTVADPGEHDAIFPGEEMEPHAAFAIADTHRRDGVIWVELVEDVEWDDRWGRLSY